MKIIRGLLNFLGLIYCKHEFEDVPSTYLTISHYDNNDDEVLVEANYTAEICKYCGIEYCDLGLNDPYHHRKI